MEDFLESGESNRVTSFLQEGEHSPPTTPAIMKHPKMRPYAGSPSLSNPIVSFGAPSENSFNRGDQRNIKICSEPIVNPCVMQMRRIRQSDLIMDIVSHNFPFDTLDDDLLSVLFSVCCFY